MFCFTISKVYAGFNYKTDNYQETQIFFIRLSTKTFELYLSKNKKYKLLTFAYIKV